jgi:hypothetical protein
MEISLEQASAILNRSEQEVLYIANNEGRLPIAIKPENDMVRNEDGTVQFVDGAQSTQEWTFRLEDVLEFKQQMDEGLVGEIERLLEG